MTTAYVLTAGSGDSLAGNASLMTCSSGRSSPPARIYYESANGVPGRWAQPSDHVLMRATAELPATDQHVVAAAFDSVVRCLATDAPVLIAIDDVQWLDPSSSAITAFAARRFAGPVGLLMTERCEPDCGSNTAWLQLARPDAINRLRMGPLSLGGLHALVSTRLGRSFPRPTMVRIAEISAGHSFYALELARAIEAGRRLSVRCCPAR